MKEYTLENKALIPHKPVYGIMKGSILEVNNEVVSKAISCSKIDSCSA